MDEPVVRRVDQPGGVVRLQLNTPQTYNALSLAMLTALGEQLASVADDPQARVLVIEGAGRGFCAGHDLSEMQEHRQDPRWQHQLFEVCSQVMQTITQAPQPVIAQVHGVATAAGLQLAASCDLVVAAEDARFALPGVNVGIFCSTPAVAVVRRIGSSRTMELLLTGTPINATTARDWGLVNQLAPLDELSGITDELAGRIAAFSSGVIARGKAAFYQQLGADLAGAYRTTSEAMVCDVTSAAAAEGMSAFLAKRTPDWPD